MHALPASHVVASLALAICTISTNDSADFGFLQFKAAQLLRLAENSGSKTLGNTWCVSHPIAMSHFTCGRILRAIIHASFLQLLAGYQGLGAKIVLLVREWSNQVLSKAACPAAPSATAFRPVPPSHNLPPEPPKSKRLGEPMS
jgi:hypothetical protein